MPRPSASEARGLRLPPAEVARFRTDVEALLGTAPDAARRLGLAVSGGSDSVAMLLLAHAAFPTAVAAATVDHGLRRESAAEAEGVAALCESLGVPHAVLRPSPDFALRGNLQTQARLARYAALERWSGAHIGWVATAHQQDDVAESFLMRAGRGAGVAGLAEMARVRPLGASPAPLVRPLLDWRRADLAAIVTAAGMSFAYDPSNADPRFDRSRVRALLARTPDLAVPRLARAARTLRDVEAALEWLVAAELPRRLEKEERGACWLVAADLPFEIQRRLVEHAVTETRRADGVDAPWRRTGVERLVRRLAAGSGGTIAGVQARPQRDRWHFRPAPPRRSH